MAHLLGIDVGERELRVAEGERLFGPPRLTALRRLPFDGADGLAAALASVAGGRAVVPATALPAAAVTHRLLALPFRDRRRLAQTVPLELLGHLPVEPDEPAVAFATIATSAAGSELFAAVARRADVAAHVAPLAAAGLAPARVDLAPLPAWNLVPPGIGDVALVIADGGRSTVSVRRAGRLAGLRALDGTAGEHAACAREVRWALAALGAMHLPVVLAGADAGDALAAALGDAGVAPVVPLATLVTLPGLAPDDLGACAVAAGLIVGGGAPTLSFAGGARAAAVPLRRAAMLAAAAVALVVLDWGIVRHGLARRDAALAAAIHATAAAALPTGRLLAPRAELEAAVAAATRAGGGDAEALAVLRELSTRVPATARPDLDELAVDAAGVTLHGRLASFDAVDALRRALAASPLLGDVTAEDTRTTVDGRGVEFRLRATRRTEGAPS